ncbi:hypothetical protein MP228_012246 [Amoeboaphelidium protococcarum]|nr:hypothetical protein MP228_012246 [Amoeboaphelidium protococcarum]
MSGLVNIRRDVKDSFYRYKMPRIQSKIEGKGNGIKTAIPNMSEVAKALARPPTYTTKYFGCELGAQVKCNEAADRYIVNGAHDAEKLQVALDGFIQRFVLCGECLNPETVLLVGKDEILRDCKACGKRTRVDMRHKLVTYIQKNPPTSSSIYDANGDSKKKGKKSKGSADDPSGDQENDGDDELLDDDDLDDDEENHDEITRQINQQTADLPVDQIKSSLDDWSADVSEEAVAARQAEFEQISEVVSKKMNLNDDGEDDGEDGVDDPLEQLADYMQSTKSFTPAELHGKISSLGIRPDKAVAVMVQVLFDDGIVQQVPKRAQYFLKLLVDNEKCQKAFIGGVERVLGVNYPQLKSKFVLVLKEAYEADLLDEEVIINWSQKSSKRYVDKDLNKEFRKIARPFVEWLENADEDDESD